MSIRDIDFRRESSAELTFVTYRSVDGSLKRPSFDRELLGLEPDEPFGEPEVDWALRFELDSLCAVN